MKHAQRLLIDPHSGTSAAARARGRRWAEFVARFPGVRDMRVLDLGGTPRAWEVAPVRPASVTTVNLLPFGSNHPDVSHVVADACEVPSSLGTFDLVFSNSLLEHVGGHVQRQRLAETVHTRASRHWVQTPYRYFPIEPHWLFPGMQFLPYPARVWVSRHWHHGHIKTYTDLAAKERVDEVELVGTAQMQGYFPGSEVWPERFAGLTKSLVAIRV